MYEEVHILNKVEKMFKPRKNKNWYFKQEEKKAVAKALQLIG